MSITEFHNSFKFRMDKMDGLNLPNFLPEEIDLLLNQAQDALVKQKYGKNNITGDSFEQTQKRIDDLQELVRTVREQPSTFNDSVENVTYNAVNFELPEDYWLLIWDKAIINCTNCNTTVTIPTAEYGQVTLDRSTNVTGIEVEVRTVTHERFQKAIKDAFAGPDHTKVLRLEYKGRIEIVPSTDCTILWYIFRYIKKPARMTLSGNITCELSDFMHEEVLNEAVSIALEGIESKRIQTFNPLINNKDE